MGINRESCWFLLFCLKIKIALYFVGGRNVRIVEVGKVVFGGLAGTRFELNNVVHGTR